MKKIAFVAAAILTCSGIPRSAAGQNSLPTRSPVSVDTAAKMEKSEWDADGKSWDPGMTATNPKAVQITDPRCQEYRVIEPLLTPEWVLSRALAIGPRKAGKEVLEAAIGMQKRYRLCGEES